MVEENQLSEVVSNTATTRELVHVPVKEWGLDQLGAFAKSAIAQSDAIEAALPGMRRTSVLQFYRAGKALWLAREELKPMGMYLKWLDEIGIAHQTAYVRTELYERVPSEKDLEGLSLSQAKKKFGIGKSEPKEGAEPKKPKPAPSGRPPDPLVLILSATAEIATVSSSISVATDMVLSFQDKWSWLHFGSVYLKRTSRSTRSYVRLTERMSEFSENFSVMAAIHEPVRIHIARQLGR